MYTITVTFSQKCSPRGEPIEVRFPNGASMGRATPAKPFTIVANYNGPMNTSATWFATSGRETDTVWKWTGMVVEDITLTASCN